MTDIQEIDLYCVEKGQGTPLIMLHGNGEDHSYFAGQLDFFAEKYRVFAIDTRGHGQSPRGTKPFTIKQFADDLYAFMNTRRLDRAVILGFSDGANIAMEFALHHPERIQKMILDGGNLYPSGMKPRYLLSVVVFFLTESFLSLFSEKHRKKAELMRLMAKEPRMSPSELAGIDTPTLVMAGTDDMIRSSHTRLIAGSLPNSQLVILQGDHFVASKCPDEFNKAVSLFLT